MGIVAAMHGSRVRAKVQFPVLEARLTEKEDLLFRRCILGLGSGKLYWRSAQIYVLSRQLADPETYGNISLNLNITLIKFPLILHFHAYA